MADGDHTGLLSPPRLTTRGSEKRNHQQYGIHPTPCQPHRVIVVISVALSNRRMGQPAGVPTILKGRIEMTFSS